jgi:hypothetical protein
VLAGDAALDQAAETLAGVLINDRNDLDRAPVGGGVELEVHRPYPIRRIGGRDIGSGGAMAFAAATLRNPQSLLTPEPLNLLVIGLPALATGIVIRRSEAAARVVLRVGAKPGPQRGVGILGGRRDGLVALGGAVLPGHAAGEPLTDPQHPLQVTNGGPPAFRA